VCITDSDRDFLVSEFFGASRDFARRRSTHSRGGASHRHVRTMCAEGGGSRCMPGGRMAFSATSFAICWTMSTSPRTCFF
jgi:hypothetical protein